MEINLRALACAIILRALDDARCDPSQLKDPYDRQRRAMWRDSARAFLSGGDLLRLWLDAAGLDAAAIPGLLDQQSTLRKRHRYPTHQRRHQTAA
jgi:hypothetical protein